MARQKKTPPEGNKWRPRRKLATENQRGEQLFPRIVSQLEHESHEGDQTGLHKLIERLEAEGKVFELHGQKIREMVAISYGPRAHPRGTGQLVFAPQHQVTNDLVKSMTSK